LKPVLAWVKQNLVVVICGVVILLVLPLSYFFSSSWATALRQKQESAAGAELTKVNASNLDYAIPSYDPAVPSISHKGAPNAALIEFFKNARAELKGQADAIAQEALDFNRGVGPRALEVGRQPMVPLIEGLFPDAKAEASAKLREDLTPEKFDALTPEDREKMVTAKAGELSRPKLDAMEDALLGKRGRPNPYQALVSIVQGGDRIDPVALRDSLKSVELRERERLTANKRELTPEEAQTLATLLADRRKAETQAHARNISTYFTLRSITGGSADYSIPASESELLKFLNKPESTKLVEYFIYQWDLWAYQDILASVALANRRPDGKLAPVEDSVVKRVESIRLRFPEGVFGNVSGPQLGDMGIPIADPVATIPGLAPLNPQVSITGRATGTWNPIFDVRRVEVQAIVSSARINEFLAAIARTNFMTVTDMDLAEVDPYEAMRQGYFYGTENVVRATLQVESVWLREWLAGYMPSAIRGALGIVEAAAGEGGAGAPASSGG
jgi:hypothetical protein